MEASKRITVLVGEPEPLYRDAVARMVRQQVRFELAGEVADGREALARIVARRPDVAVLSTSMPGLGGERVLNAVVRDGLPTRVVLLAARVSPGDAYRAIEAGAAGCLTKLAGPDQLCEAVATAARGGTFLGREVQSGLAREIRLRRNDERPLLSDRERQILRLVADGCSAPAIAGRLHLGRATVKTHLAHVYGKLEVSERAAAVAEAMRRGLLE
jgi:two-component system nitrate/nitrite response regulator NarL